MTSQEESADARIASASAALAAHLSTPQDPPTDEAFERAVKAGGDHLADAMGWHPGRGDYDMARLVLEVARPILEELLRAETERQGSQLEATRKMLRVECAEYDANDWPDTLHLADVVEKYLARQARLAVQDADKRADRLSRENIALRDYIVSPYMLSQRAAMSDNAMEFTSRAELEAERVFLLARSQARDHEFSGDRWTGISSDALVAYAFGQKVLGCNYMGSKPGEPPPGRRSGWICSGTLGHPEPHHSGDVELEHAYPSDPTGYPHDPSDLLACERTWLRLPEHLKTPAVRHLLEVFREGVERNYPNANARVQGYLASDPAL